MKVSIGISNRHIHLTRESIDYLFGKDYELTKLRDLNQIGQYACVETLTLKNEKGTFENVRIIGPERPFNQIEISKTDSFKLGLNPPVRNSGDIKGSLPITLVNGEKELSLDEGIIIADRHVHVDPKTAEELNYTDGETVSLKVYGDKPGILGNVRVRISDNAYYEVHLDTDDANAFLLKNNDEVEVIK